MDHNHPLNCQIWWFEEVSDYLFPGRRHPICKGAPLVAYKQNANQCDKDIANANQVFFFLAGAFAPDSCDLIWSFSSWPLQLCQWPPRSSNLEDQTSGANLQMEGHMNVLSQS